MRYELLEIAYDRQTAVEYANYWAYRRNPRYYAFDEIGGDCTNFVSQCLYAGSGVMNFTTTVWLKVSLPPRAIWTTSPGSSSERAASRPKGPGPRFSVRN